MAKKTEQAMRQINHTGRSEEDAAAGGFHSGVWEKTKH